MNETGMGIQLQGIKIKKREVKYFFQGKGGYNGGVEVIVFPVCLYVEFGVTAGCLDLQKISQRRLGAVRYGRAPEKWKVQRKPSFGW